MLLRVLDVVVSPGVRVHGTRRVGWQIETSQLEMDC